MIIPVSPVQDRTEEMRRAGGFQNEGGTLGAWIVTEAAWFATMFAKIALSVVFSRYVYSVFESQVVPKSIFDKAHDLMQFGRRPRPYRVPPGAAPPPGYGSPSGGGAPGGSSSSAPPTSRNGDASQYAQAPQFESHGAEKARIVKQVGEFTLAHHDTRLRADHFWPCPITNHREGCADCGFFLIKNRVAMCAAVEKLKQILNQRDDGSDLYELRERLEKGA
jgi:hypothetical protein